MARQQALVTTRCQNLSEQLSSTTEVNVSKDTLTNSEPNIFLEHNSLHILNEQNNTSSSLTNDAGTADSVLNEVKKWALTSGVNQSQLSSLLKILNQHNCFSTWPSDSRTLLKGKCLRNYDIIDVLPGKYVHFGLTNYLDSIVKIKYTGQLKLQISIDGLPLFNSNSVNLWPVLGHFSNFSNSKPFVIGIYCGLKKPTKVEDFLNLFIAEYKIARSKKDTLIINCFVCDTPARAFIKCVKGHNAYFGCDKCCVEGNYSNHRMNYSDVGSNLRTDDSFRNKIDEDHHVGTTPLLQIRDLDMVKCFPLDYMHLVCLGVVKKLLILWTRGKPKTQKLSSFQINEISTKLEGFSKITASEFSRKPRTLSELDRWKATEFRQFLLYSGPVILENTLVKENYLMFISLSISIRILCSEKHYLKYNDYAHKLLLYFVQTFKRLYGEDYISYNIHGLVHLAADAKNLGALDTFSAFKFEHKLGKIKKLVKSPNRPLQQIVNRLKEQEFIIKFSSDSYKLSKLHNNGPLISKVNDTKQYRCYQTAKLIINCDFLRDSFLLTKSGELIQVYNILQHTCSNKIQCVAKSVKNVSPYFTEPIDSSLFDIYRADLNNCGELKLVDISDIMNKCQIYNIAGSQSAIFGLIHAELSK